MALPSAGNPISFKDINEEIGNTGNAELDLKTASETFGDTEPFGMDELLGLSSARLQLSIKYLVQQEQGESDRDTGWISTASSISSTKGELVLCAEAAAPAEDARSNGLEFRVDTENTDFNSDGSVSNGDTLFNSNSGATLSSRRPDSGLINQETFLCETVQSKIFQVNSSGVISNVRSRTPSQPSQPTLNADSSTQITVTIPSTDTSVTREFKLQRSINGGSYSDRATFVPSDSGSIDDTSISTTFVDDSGISAGDVVKYRVRGSNAFEDSPLSTESATVTTPTGTSWGSFTNYSMTLGSGTSQTLESPEKSLTLTNGSGNTTISIVQPSNSNPPPDLEIKVGNSSGNYNLISSYTETPSAIAAASTYFFKTKLSQAGSKNNASEDCDIVFTNNGVQKTITVTVEIGGGGLGDP